ncbi:unnamed protein product [Parajaminaea phylloscopi]
MHADTRSKVRKSVLRAFWSDIENTNTQPRVAVDAFVQSRFPVQDAGPHLCGAPTPAPTAALLRGTRTVS